MIGCVISRGSSTTKWLSAVNRSYATSTLSSDEQNGSANTTKSARAGGTRKGKGSGDTQDASFMSLYGPESRPYKPRDLPISPLMDPKAIAARQKHHLPKPLPTKTPSLSQQQLAKNPYAQALATPVRMCQMTKVPLPNYFLQDFELMAHPDTREPWWVSTSLRKKHEEGIALEARDEVEHEQHLVVDQDLEPCAVKPVSSTTTHAESATPSYPLEKQPAPLNHTHNFGPGTYILSRRALISAMQNSRSGWDIQPHRSFLAGSIMRSTIAKKVREKASWRTDMDTFILELMRRRIVEGLVYLVQRKRGYVAGCVDWEDTKKTSRQPAAILWTGMSRSEAAEHSSTDSRLDQAQYPEHEGPPSFATLTVGKDQRRMVPVHNLSTLLGLEHLAELKKRGVVGELLVLKHKRVTVDIQMKLWKIQGYLGFPEPEYDMDIHKKGMLAKKGPISADEEEKLGGKKQREPRVVDETQDRPQRRRKAVSKGSEVREEGS